jgi:hypothetical protein
MTYAPERVFMRIFGWGKWLKIERIGGKNAQRTWGRHAGLRGNL